MGALLGLRGSTGLLAALVVGAAAGCGPSSVTFPAVPAEIQMVAAVYDTPTGTVPVDAKQPIAELQQKLDTINQTRLGDLMTDTLVKLRARLSGGGIATDPASAPKSNWPLIRGSVTLDRICRGWDDASTTPNPTDGAIQLIAEVDNSRLDRTLWGAATACHGRVDVTDTLTVHTYVDGALAVYLEGPLPHDVTDASFLMGWNGTLGTENAQTAGGFDFRVVSPQVEVRIAVSDGDIIGSVGLDQVSLRGSNGTFGCSLTTFTCGRLQTARGDAPAP